jgi:hypothetical protein
MVSQPSSSESPDERNERIFQSLPSLSSPEYRELLKTASANDLPAPVLVRAFRQLRTGRNADLTLERLLTTDSKYGYLRPLRRMARRRVSKNDWFSPDDLVDQSISFIAIALTGPQGENAHKYWVNFLKQRLEDAYRSLVGRRGERQDPPRIEHVVDPGSDDTREPWDRDDALPSPFHGRVAPDKLRWLESFIKRVLAKINDDRIREVALDQFSADPSPVSGKARHGKTPLTIRYSVDRGLIYRWLRIARLKLAAELRAQDECDIDLSFLE